MGPHESNGGVSSIVKVILYKLHEIFAPRNVIIRIDIYGLSFTYIKIQPQRCITKMHDVHFFSNYFHTKLFIYVCLIKRGVD